MDTYAWEKRWEELDSALRERWGDAYERRAFAARRVLDAGGPQLLRALAEFPHSLAFRGNILSPSRLP
jgi:hypothetical protein